MRHLRSILPALLALATAGAASAAPGYYRFPAERGGTVVFTAEGDLWTVPLAGGTARRLTTHPAEESQAAISPDGRSVAFVAAYDGVPDVYVMPIAGGEPRRLSFDGGRVFIAGFDPRGAVVYASENVSGPTLRRVLRRVDPVSGATTGIPLADANEAAFGDDGTVYFTRYGLHMSGDNARDYRGGAMAQLWRWSGAEGVEGVEAQRIGADLGANLSRPMFAGGRLYAVSDADGVANLWSMAPDGSDRRQLTKHRDYEVRGATLGSGRIVYQHGADLRVYELASGDDRVLPVELVSDFEQRRERFLRKPLLFASGATFAPAGDRAVLAVRGRIALAGTGPLRRIEVALPDGARARNAVLSLDGKTVYAIVDAGADSEVWRFPADGTPGGEALTRDGSAHRWRLYPSPDGRWLAHDDKQGRLWITDLREGGTRLLDASEHARDDAFQALAWAPDGRWLAVSRPDSARQIAQIVLLEAGGARKAVLTSDKYDSSAPAFSRDGRWLYFLSDRAFQSSVQGPWGDRNTGAFFDRRTRVYALALQADARFPFQPRNELLAATDAADAAAKDGPGQGRARKGPRRRARAAGDRTRRAGRASA